MIQAAAGNRDVPGVVVGVGSDVPARTDAGAVPPEVRHQPPVRDLHRPHRREQGLRRAVLATSSATPYAFPRGLDLVLVGSAIMTVPEHPRIHHLGLPGRSGQVRRAGGLGPADHAVVLREPVDGGARGVGARPAGAGQRPLRRAEGPVHPQQRRALLRELRGVRRGALLARVERTAATRALGRNGREFFQRALRLAGDRAEVPRHVRPARSEDRAAEPRRIEPLPGLVRAAPARPAAGADVLARDPVRRA